MRLTWCMSCIIITARFALAGRRSQRLEVDGDVRPGSCAVPPRPHTGDDWADHQRPRVVQSWPDDRSVAVARLAVGLVSVQLRDVV
jgi:hypothetical protein